MQPESAHDILCLEDKNQERDVKNEKNDNKNVSWKQLGNTKVYPDTR